MINCIAFINNRRVVGVDDAAKKQTKVAPIKKQVITPIQEEITAEPIVLEKNEYVHDFEEEISCNRILMRNLG